MTLVVDASVVVAALIDTTELGSWAEDALRGQHLVAPALLPFEVANIVHRLSAAGQLSVDVAALAHRDLLLMPIELVGYEPLAIRAWDLRDTLTAYDASYVAVAEMLAAPLATLDLRLSKAPGTRCSFQLPPKIT